MKISVLTNGTAGDVLPFISLSAELQKLGHTVTLGAPDGYQQHCEQYCLSYIRICDDIRGLMAESELDRIIGGNLLSIYRYWCDNIKPQYHRLLRKAWLACKDADVIVYHPKVFCAPDIAEKTGAQLILLSLLPLFRTKQFPVPVMNTNLGGFLNQLSYELLSFTRLPFISLINKWRTKELALPKGKVYQPIDRPLGQKIPCLCAVSDKVLIRPRDWASNIHMMDNISTEKKPLPVEVQHFLNRGETPFYIGFGSMSHTRHSQLTEMLKQAVAKYDIRFIVANGWSQKLARADISEQILFINNASHASLFPLVRGVIHHGGAGTTMAALAANKPMFICPHGMDQAFWGHQVHKRGLGVKPINIKKLNIFNFLEAIGALINLEQKLNKNKQNTSSIHPHGSTLIAQKIHRIITIEPTMNRCA